MESYGMQASSAPSPRVGLNQARRGTKIEELTEQLSKLASQMNLQNDNLEQKLEMFGGLRPQVIEKNLIDEPAPPVGTFAALDHAGRRLSREASRYAHLVERLGEIF